MEVHSGEVYTLAISSLTILSVHGENSTTKTSLIIIVFTCATAMTTVVACGFLDTKGAILLKMPLL